MGRQLLTRGRRFLPAVGVSSAFVVMLAISGTVSGEASAQQGFYDGKTIRVMQGRKPGGTGDKRVRALQPYLEKYLGDNVTFVNEYTSSGMLAANYTSKQADKNGLTVANIGGSLISDWITNTSGVDYNLLKDFYFLGTPNSAVPYIFVSRSELGLKTVEDLKKHKGLRVGGQNVGTRVYAYGRLVTWVLEMMNESVFVTGYSGPEIDLALKRGEVDARAQLASSPPRRSPEWYEKGTMNFNLVFEIPEGNGMSNYPEYPKEIQNIPKLQDYANTKTKQEILALARALIVPGSPWIMPAGAPEEARDQFRAAMDKSFADPDFRKDFEKMTGDAAEPMTGRETEAAIKAIPDDPDVVKLYQTITATSEDAAYR